ncbi:beta-mannanase [Paenibacillus sp. P3E]|uniref:beta-mannanase n=1 Tax=unclassified Paenibacillus TaxID=185978 RepID=UPI00093EFBA3|nr:MULTISPECIES: beta-mannanase [unclassified Paenibacillus]OKP92881.1 beta-mannanase [Paenibacillus sp. P3E]OKP94509.1 beta-mannanase [Paenibacillus sp. P32E]
MRYAEVDSSTPVIMEVSSRMEDRFCTLRWHWPDGVQAVYIHKSPAEAPDNLELPPPGMKLYTREEYKANNGYRDRLDDIGLVVYTVYVRLADGGDILLVRQRDGANRTLVSAGKARIYYSIQQKKGLFGKQKTVHMTLTAEVPVSKEVLCYVKKRGGFPASKEDGVLFPFVQDFAAGRNVLPPIEIGKEDAVRIFFTDGRKYGLYYELIPE